MTRLALASLTILGLGLVPAGPALAGPTDTAPAPAPAATPTAGAKGPSTYAFGARVGGYGFRRDSGDSRNEWDECRMNGLGLFGERKLGRFLFVETGLDFYFTESFPLEPNEGDLPIDRMSGLVTAAAGMRASATSWLSGYAQVGVGLELTRVSVPYADRELTDQLAMPIGFLGIGGDVKIGAKTYLGANLRAHVMGNFDYDPAKLEMQPGWTEPPNAGEVFDPSPDLAAQGQFYLRRDI
jgi:hypothetical protein